MKIIDTCAECLFSRQANITDNKEYLSEIRELLDTREESDSAPYMVYKFSKVFEKYFGKKDSFANEKKQYNDLVLSMEDTIRKRIEESSNPFATSLLYSRIGNYIDFGAMNSVDEGEFIALFDKIVLSDKDEETLKSFIALCERSKTFLLITDNCGEIVLDKLFLEQLCKRFPNLSVSVLVRGAEVLNDATLADALYVGMDKYASIYTNGMPIAGTVYEELSEDAKIQIDTSEVILAKGQGNYESMCGQGFHVFYLFLCKCEMFTNRFGVPKLTGMFIEEK